MPDANHTVNSCWNIVKQIRREWAKGVTCWALLAINTKARTSVGRGGVPAI